jgi:hypothetical protein
MVIECGLWGHRGLFPPLPVPAQHLPPPLTPTETTDRLDHHHHHHIIPHYPINIPLALTNCVLFLCQASSASLNYPYFVYGDTNGNLFIAEWANRRVRLVSTSTGIITPFAGTGDYSSTGDGGQVDAIFIVIGYSC